MMSLGSLKSADDLAIADAEKGSGFAELVEYQGWRLAPCGPETPAREAIFYRDAKIRRIETADQFARPVEIAKLRSFLSSAIAPDTFLREVPPAFVVSSSAWFLQTRRYLVRIPRRNRAQPLRIRARLSSICLIASKNAAELLCGSLSAASPVGQSKQQSLGQRKQAAVLAFCWFSGASTHLALNFRLPSSLTIAYTTSIDDTSIRG